MHFASRIAAIAAATLLAISPAVAQDETPEYPSEPYEEGEIVRGVADFFEITTESAAKVVERVFERFGRPNAYIAGEEASGAFVFGLRYGKGLLYRKGQAPVTVYWQGPSIGFDIGGNASKCFTLVYNLPQTDAIYQRFPGIEGTYYFVAGIGVNYQQNGDIVLAPMRTGLGLRAGVNAGYLAYSRKRNWVPL
ncbi:MAG: DUF1134 domain-containing protein [Alphaproteobacteria bacterium]